MSFFPVSKAASLRIDAKAVKQPPGKFYKYPYIVGSKITADVDAVCVCETSRCWLA